MIQPKFPILHVWWDELRELVKDEGILIFVILLPLGYPILYAMIYDTEVQRELPICVVDDCMSGRSRGGSGAHAAASGIRHPAYSPRV